MKTIRITAIATALALSASLGWFVGGPATAQAASSQSASGGMADAMPDPAQIGRGAQAWANTCSRCHNLRDPGEFSDKNWNVIVTHMRVIAPLPGQEAEDIKVFLKSSN